MPRIKDFMAVYEGKRGDAAVKRTLFSVWGLAFLLAISSLAWGHGTQGNTELADGIRVTAEYDDGEPMSYAAIEITAPDSEIVFQKGRTDRNGVFMFAPDGPGRWRIAVSDGMGHRLVLNREIAEHEETASAPPAAAASGEGSPSRKQGLISGLAIIFGICGCLYGWKAGHQATTR